VTFTRSKGVNLCNRQITVLPRETKSCAKCSEPGPHSGWLVPGNFLRAFALASALATTVISYVLEQLAASIFRVVQQHFIFNTLPENLFCNFDNPIEFHSHEVVHTCQYHCFNKICLMRSFAGLSRRRFGFDPRPVHVRFVVDKVAL